MRSIIFFLFSGLAIFFYTSCDKQLSDKVVPDSLASASKPAVTPAVTGTTYYVSPSGNDANNGTSTSTPWKTISKVNAHTYSPGDEILFQGGQTFTGTLTASSSGSGSAYIIYSHYGTGSPTINGGTGDGMDIHDQSWVGVDGLVFTGGWNSSSQSGNAGTGVNVTTDQTGSAQMGEVYIDNCTVSGFQYGGISFGSSPSDGSQSGYSVVTIYNNVVHDNGAYGISTWGNEGASGNTTYCYRYIWIGNNAVYSNYGVKSHTSGHTGDGIVIGQAGSGLVLNNAAYNNGWDCVAASGGPAAIWCWDSKGLTFQNNVAYGNGTGNAVDGDGFDLDGGTVNCTMEYNYSYNNKGAGYLVWEFGDTRNSNNNNIVRYNLSQNDGGSGSYASISTGANCTNNLFYNNTLYNSNSLGTVAVWGGSGNQYYNNIFYTSAGQSLINVTGTSAWFMNNNYYAGGSTIHMYYNGGSYTSLSAFRSGTGCETLSGTNYGYSVNPGLAGAGSGNYHLNAGSPMINTGFDLTSWGWNVGTVDYYGASIPYNGAYDIGASEYH